MNISDGVKRLKGLIDRIDVSSFPIPIRMSASRDERNIALVIHMEVRPRPLDTTIVVADGAKMSVMFRRTIYVHSLKEATDDLLIGVIRRQLADCLAHELDEHILVDGKRTFDPHKDEARP